MCHTSTKYLTTFENYRYELTNGNTRGREVIDAAYENVLQ
jgi:hypothetical protein